MSFGHMMGNYLALWRLKWSLIETRVDHVISGTRAGHVFFGGEP